MKKFVVVIFFAAVLSIGFASKATDGFSCMNVNTFLNGCTTQSCGCEPNPSCWGILGWDFGDNCLDANLDSRCNGGSYVCRNVAGYNNSRGECVAY